MDVIRKKRIEVVDALRGFAIMGILLLHSIEHFNFYVFPDKSTQPDWLNRLDDSIWETFFFLFGGKGYAIFAILFGFTFCLMSTKQLNLGKDFGLRFFWRMILLACFAFFNGLFFPGEVLLMYSMVGLILIVVRKWNEKGLLIASIVLLAQPIEWGHYLYYLCDKTYTFPTWQSGGLWRLLAEGQQGTSFFTLIKNNTLFGHKAGLMWALEVGRLVQTAGLFILGYWIGKKKLFIDSNKSKRFWKQTLIIASVAFVPLFVLELNFENITDLKIHRDTIFKVIDMYGNLAFTLILVSGFILLYQSEVFRKISTGLRYCGRMSLTAYVFQSVLGGFVFYGYGLGLGPSVRHTASLGIGILLLIIQIQFCKFWIKKYGQGPLEKLWHKLTWIRQDK
ncbi:DUF418 domain-containing protein [Seonamhaeicola maritimus]|uniref:DUF418 domain-containing protein n=1 Tax=Seonamhaeicola maritimus TaxID=2591822 RepID=A0A5C7GDX9_9FLAO|nr:DUF418 domain-containing protein [Seonamhaeicola maritimus]TXG34759.1 DUF418 domain-containing protein [Seonamhaeicola maritimus]